MSHTHLPCLKLRQYIPSWWKWLIPFLVVVLTGSLAAWLVSSHNGRRLPAFGKIWRLYSFKPEITATAYDSPKANATIIWLSGIDESPGEFGQIWKVYSYQPAIVPTAYNSPKANATVIWLSGIDEHLSDFSQIWRLYTFKPEVTATTYNSQKGNATIIWLSGMDNGRTHKASKAASPSKP